MPERLRTAVREFVRTMYNPDDLDDLLDRLLWHANSALGCAGAVIVLEDDRGRLAFAAASSEMVPHAERVKSEIQTGVCHESFLTGEVLAVCDLTSTDRWGDYTERLVTRGTVERATGIIMQREGVDSDPAFARLRTTSLNGNQNVRDVGRQIIEGHECQWPALAMPATSHQPSADTPTASGPDGIPVGAASAVVRAQAFEETCDLADVPSWAIEQRLQIGPLHDSWRKPAD